MRPLKYSIGALVGVAVQVGCPSAGGGNGGESATYTSHTPRYEAGATVTVSDNAGDLARGGYPIFVGWNTASDGSGELYVPGDTFTVPSSDTTLYAAWIDDAEFFDARGFFGSVVAMSGEYAIVGARSTDDGGDEEVGAAYVSGGFSANDSFGNTVAISDDVAIVGASGSDTAYYFFRTGTDTWSDGRPFGVTGDNIGGTVAVSGDRALIGASATDANRGAVYLFRRVAAVGATQYISPTDNPPGFAYLLRFAEDDSWTGTRFVSRDTTNNRSFGLVAIDTENVVVGDGGYNSFSFAGAAHVWRHR